MANVEATVMTSCLALGLVGVLALSGCSSAQPAKDNEAMRVEEPTSRSPRSLAAEHVAALRAGDWATGGGLQYPLVPTRLEKLISLGPSAAPALLVALLDETPTHFIYCGKLTFTGGASSDRARWATVGDMADHALRNIYGVDVGFYSYLPPEEKRLAVARWEEVVFEKGISEGRRTLDTSIVSGE